MMPRGLEKVRGVTSVFLRNIMIVTSYLSTLTLGGMLISYLKYGNMEIDIFAILSTAFTAVASGYLVFRKRRKDEV